MIHKKFMIHYCMIYFKLWLQLFFSFGEWWGRWEVGGGEGEADSLMVIGDGYWLQIQKQVLLVESFSCFNLVRSEGEGEKAIALHLGGSRGRCIQMDTATAAGLSTPPSAWRSQSTLPIQRQQGSPADRIQKTHSLCLQMATRNVIGRKRAFHLAISDNDFLKFLDCNRKSDFAILRSEQISERVKMLLLISEISVVGIRNKN